MVSLLRFEDGGSDKKPCIHVIVLTFPIEVETRMEIREQAFL